MKKGVKHKDDFDSKIHFISCSKLSDLINKEASNEVQVKSDPVLFKKTFNRILVEIEESIAKYTKKNLANGI